ncbi:MAG: glycosyltransferase family 4 protein [Elusimicrobiota bacterium]
MKVGIIAPPFITIPPKGYGGTELVIYNLVEGLSRLGHKVILFAPKYSKTSADNFIPYIDSDEITLNIASPLMQKLTAMELCSKFAYSFSAYKSVDVIHDHTLSNNIVDKPSIHTLHGPATEGSVNKCVEISNNPLNHFVSISKKQKEMYLTLSKNINFAGTVYNSIDVKTTEWNSNKEDFLLFVGRINWEKGPDMAVRVAAKLKKPLVMVVKMSEDFEKEFFSRKIQPLLDRFPKSISIKMYEEPPHDFKFKLYQKAKCTLFTSQWEEPFGLVMIESMASGTPVVALKRGAAPEVIAHGKTGFLVNNEKEMIEALKDIDKIKPEDCRKHVEKYFSVEKMAENYANLYKNIL